MYVVNTFGRHFTSTCNVPTRHVAGKLNLLVSYQSPHVTKPSFGVMVIFFRAINFQPAGLQHTV
jgi:hypothetical protein